MLCSCSFIILNITHIIPNVSPMLILGGLVLGRIYWLVNTGPISGWDLLKICRSSVASGLRLHNFTLVHSGVLKGF